MNSRSTIKQFESQHDDEEIILVFRQHPVVMRRGLVWLLIFWVAGLLPFSYYFDQRWALYMLISGTALGLVAMFYAWISWYFTLHILTNQRFLQMKQQGLFKRTVVDLGLDKIQNINYQIAGIQETLLGFGTIIIQTFVGDLVLKYIHHPAKIQAQIIKTIKDNGFEYRGQEIEEG